MVAVFSQSTNWTSAGTSNASPSGRYKDVTVTGCQVGDLLVAVGASADAGTSGQTRQITTNSGTTSAWTLSQPAVVNAGDVDVIGGFATVSTAGTVVVRVQVRPQQPSTDHMGAGVLRVPAAEWSGTPTWQGTSSNGFVASATGRLNYTCSAGATVFYFGADWNVGTIASNAGTPASANYAVRVVDSGVYSVYGAWWTAQTASARDYGPSALTGRDFSGVVLNIPAAASGVTGTIAATGPAGTQSGSGTVTQPTYSGAITAIGPQGTQSASGTVTQPTYSGAITAVGPAGTQSASGTVTIPTYTGAITAVGPAGEQSASGTVTQPVYDGTITASGPMGVQSVSGTVSQPEYTGVITATGPAGTQSATGTVDSPVTYGPSEWGTANSTLLDPGEAYIAATGPMGVSAITGTVVNPNYGPSEWGTANATLEDPLGPVTATITATGPMGTQSATGTVTAPTVYGPSDWGTANATLEDPSTAGAVVWVGTEWVLMEPVYWDQDTETWVS